MCSPLSTLSTVVVRLLSSMRFLWFYLFFYAVSGQSKFGTSYYGDSRLCKKWSCLNQKSNFTDELPPKERYLDFLKNILPLDNWHRNAESAVDVCYSTNSTKKYTNTCPGQRLMHCVVNILIQNCPVENTNKDDACAPVASLAGYNYLFSQSRYENMEKNLPVDRRPASFLRKYFRVSCCDLPPLFNESLLQECGFENFMHYNYHATQKHTPFGRDEPRVQDVTQKTNSEGILKGQVYNFYNVLPESSTTNIISESTPKFDEGKERSEPIDPLDCCDVNEFIKNSWRSECDFKLKWDVTNRLSVYDVNEITTTTEKVSLKHSDVKIVPNSCENQQCIFERLNVLSNTGVFDKDAFGSLLDNMTKSHPTWAKAKDRVVSQCLKRPLLGYDGKCDINNILSCTFDILSENCPYPNKEDLCKLNTSQKEGVICQISSSKYRPKHRRQFCDIPNMVDREVLQECGVTSIFHLEYIEDSVPKPRNWSNLVNCQQLTPSTSCLMNKMDVLTKYGFVDHFKMKHKIRTYSDGLMSQMYELYNAAFQDSPYYHDYCHSPKKLLNVLDSILMTCPWSNRNTDERCTKLFSDLRNSLSNNNTKESFDKMMSHNQNVYLPSFKVNEVNNKKESRIQNTRLYDFGFLGSNEPLVFTIDLKPKNKTLVLLPVYQRTPKNNPLAINSLHNDGVFRD